MILSKQLDSQGIDMNLFSHSLINKIKILGFILVFLMLFILLIAYEAKIFNIKKSYVHHAIQISQLLTQKSDKLHIYLQTNSIKTKTTATIIQSLRQTKPLISDILIRKTFAKSGIQLYKNSDSVFFLIQDQNRTLFFESKRNLITTVLLPISLFTLLFFLIIFGIYYYIKSAFSPLVRLQKNIEHFSKAQEIDIEYENANDEIANIANAFYSALEHNKKLKLQKDMYICMVMHEISTPLTKAKFITHFMQNQQEKEKLNALFNSIQDELDKLHEFESISTKISNMHMSHFSINALLEDVCDVLLLDEKEITIIGEEIEQKFDYNLFIVAVKNLIDNAIKYSHNSHVTVHIHKKFIEIKNNSINEEALNIQKLLKPFKQGNECSSGMGLGLFLIDEIITKHNFGLDYSFSDGSHIFRISFYPEHSSL